MTAVGSGVTAIIPTHNQTPFLLARAISSAASICDEVLVVVDRSQVLPPHPEPCVSYHHSYGAGISAALNLGIERASYPRLAFLDSDDTWLDDKSTQFHHPWPATFTAFRWTTGHESWCCDKLSRIFTDNVPCRSTTVVTRDLALAVGGYDESLVWCQDWDFHAQIELACGWMRIGALLAEITDNPEGHTRTAESAQRNYCRRIVQRRNRERQRLWEQRRQLGIVS